MYPESELTALARRKAVMRRRIARHRGELAEAAGRVAKPLAWLDRAVAICRRISPLALLAALPLGFIVKRTVSPRLKIVGSLVKWAPIVFSAVRGFSAVAKTRLAPRKS